jgi:hypothetical protein
MNGDDRARFCTRCALAVHDLSAMTDADARTLLIGPAEQLCVRFGVRRDGTIVTNSRMRRLGRSLSAVILAFAAVPFWSGVILFQRPWRALAHRVAASTSPAPLQSRPGEGDDERRRAYEEVMKRLADSSRLLWTGSTAQTTTGALSTSERDLLRRELAQHRQPRKHKLKPTGR